MFSRCFVQSVRCARFSSVTRPRYAPKPRSASAPLHATPTQSFFRAYSATSADEAIEEITELYATARDEFEIAMEETEKVSVYAEDDRKAAREELEKLQAAFKAAVEGPDQELGEEVKRRVGSRVRELENAVKNMEEMAMNQD